MEHSGVIPITQFTDLNDLATCDTPLRVSNKLHSALEWAGSHEREGQPVQPLIG